LVAIDLLVNNSLDLPHEKGLGFYVHINIMGIVMFPSNHVFNRKWSKPDAAPVALRQPLL
jgi:hypothetical protein